MLNFLKNKNARKQVARKLMEEKKAREDELREVHKLQKDILYCIEGGEKLNAAQLCSHEKALARVLKLRRNLMLRIAALDGMITELIKGKKSIPDILQMGRDTERELGDNILESYKPDYLKTTDFKDKNNNIADEVGEAIHNLGLEEFEKEYERKDD